MTGSQILATSLKTNEGITKGSTFADVEKSYGDNFLKKNYKNFMGSGKGYWITYVDKNNRSKITFEFNEHNDERVSYIIFSKY